MEKRGDRPRPRLSDIDLMDIYDIVPAMCIRDTFENNEDLKCRYWGSEFEWAYKINCTGKFVHETYNADGVRKTLELHKRALAASSPLRLIGNLGYADKTIDYITFEGIMACVDGTEQPKQHIIAVGQFDYQLDDEDRALFREQTGKSFP